MILLHRCCLCGSLATHQHGDEYFCEQHHGIGEGE